MYGDHLLEILENLKVVGLCSILLVLFRTADILFGIANAKKKKVLFNRKKFLWGIFYTICAVFGLAALITGLSAVIPIITMCGVITDDTINNVLDVVNITAICGAILYVSIVTYGKSAYEKFNIFIGKDKGDNND